MPSSDPTSIPKVLAVVDRIKPRSILDLGVGNGRYGFLFREALDWNYGRLAKGDWWVKIEGVEIDASYLNPIHDYVYDTVMVGDFNALSLERRYTLAFFGDVLEHWPDGLWRQALEKARWVCRIDDGSQETRHIAEWVINPAICQQFAGQRREVMEAKQRRLDEIYATNPKDTVHRVYGIDD